MFEIFGARVSLVFIGFAPILCHSLSEADKSHLLNRHNTYRCMHGVPLMKWDAQVASSAQDWVDHVRTFSHGSGSYNPYGKACGCGENLAGTGGPDPKGATDMWYGEFKNYKKWDLNHFTAMIWKDVRFLGCGVRVKGPAWGGAFVVCRYKPGDGLMMPNMAGGAQKYVPLGIVKSMSECEKIAADFGEANSDDGDGISTHLIIGIICAVVITFICCLCVVRAARRARRKSGHIPWNDLLHGKHETMAEAANDAKLAEEAMKEETTEDFKMLKAASHEAMENAKAALKELEDAAHDPQKAEHKLHRKLEEDAHNAIEKAREEAHHVSDAVKDPETRKKLKDESMEAIRKLHIAKDAAAEKAKETLSAVEKAGEIGKEDSKVRLAAIEEDIPVLTNLKIPISLHSTEKDEQVGNKEPFALGAGHSNTSKEAAILHLHESDMSRHVPALESARGKQNCMCSCDGK